MCMLLNNNLIHVQKIIHSDKIIIRINVIL